MRGRPPDVKLAPLDPAYPRLLCHLDQPPEITVSGPLDTDRRVVAIVGSRGAKDATLGYVHFLAYHLAKAGVIVISGGAAGVDRLAHEGALKAGGTTWCVACTGRGQCYPPENADLFARIEASPSSRMIWPFADGIAMTKKTPRVRNGVLVALAECVVVVQAALTSGSRNAASWARYLGRRLVISPGHPWEHAYVGSHLECLRGEVDVLWSTEHLFEMLALPPPDLEDEGALINDIRPPEIQARPRRRQRRQPYSAAPLYPVEIEAWSEDEKLVFSMLSIAPTHQDALVDRTGLPTSSTLTALLTLSLKDVVVEGPDGFFRRRIAL